MTGYLAHATGGLTGGEMGVLGVLPAHDRRSASAPPVTRVATSTCLFESAVQWLKNSSSTPLPLYSAWQSCDWHHPTGSLLCLSLAGLVNKPPPPPPLPPPPLVLLPPPPPPPGRYLIVNMPPSLPPSLPAGRRKRFSLHPCQQ